MSSIEPPKEELGELNSGKTGWDDGTPLSMIPAKGGDWGTECIHLLNPKMLPIFPPVLLTIANLAAIAEQHHQVAIEDSERAK